MNLTFLIPTIILISTIVIYKIVSKGLDTFLSEMKQKADEINKIRQLSFFRELLKFFFDSNASETAQMVVDNLEKNDDYLESSLDSAAAFVGKDVENLYDEMRKSNAPQIEYERIKFESGILLYTLIISGITISVLEYVLIVYFTLFGRTSFFNLFDGGLFGGTAIMAFIILLIAIDLRRLSKRLNSMEDDLKHMQKTDNKSRVSQEY